MTSRSFYGSAAVDILPQVCLVLYLVISVLHPDKSSVFLSFFPPLQGAGVYSTDLARRWGSVDFKIRYNGVY